MVVGVGVSRMMSRFAEMVCRHVAWGGHNVTANSRTSGLPIGDRPFLVRVARKPGMSRKPGFLIDLKLEMCQYFVGFGIIQWAVTIYQKMLATNNPLKSSP